MAPGIRKCVLILVWMLIQSMMSSKFLHLITSQLLHFQNKVDEYLALLIVLRAAVIK